MCTTVNLTIPSLNVRGIREQTKRKSIFSYRKDQRANIYFLQETYSEPADEIVWKNEWCNGETACEGLDRYPGLTSGGNIIHIMYSYIDFTVFRT